jgi:hypothetical protein
VSSGYELDVMKFHTAGRLRKYGRPVTPSESPHLWDEDRPASLQKGSVAVSLGSSRASTATSFLSVLSRAGKNHQMYGRTQITIKATIYRELTEFAAKTGERLPSYPAVHRADGIEKSKYSGGPDASQ